MADTKCGCFCTPDDEYECECILECDCDGACPVHEKEDHEEFLSYFGIKQGQTKDQRITQLNAMRPVGMDAIGEEARELEREGLEIRGRE
jgi:hypothetical protein